MDSEDRTVFSLVPEPPEDTWRYGPLDDHVADVYLPETKAGAPVVLIHGGFWRVHYDRTHLRPLAAALAATGRLVVSLEFRRIPGEPDATVDDLHLALDRLHVLLATHGHSQFSIAGHSAGGHLALLMAHRTTSPDLLGCVALAPVADLVIADELALDGDAVADFIGGPATTRPDLDPARLSAPDVHVVLVHGDRDTLVPIALSESYAVNTGIDFDPLDDCGHFEVIDPRSPAWPHLLAALAAIERRDPAR